MKSILQPGAKLRIFCLSLLIGSLMTLVNDPAILQGNAQWGLEMLIVFTAYSGTCFFGVLAVLECRKSGNKTPDIYRFWTPMVTAFSLGTVPSLLSMAQ